MTSFQNAYESKFKLDNNEWITDPRVPNPDNLPEPLGYTILVRPYRVVQDTKISSLIIPQAEIDFVNRMVNVARVIKIGPCAWNKKDQWAKDGNGDLVQKDWVQVGDFITFPKHSGSRRKFRGVSFVLLSDDEINERLPDPQIFDGAYFKLDLPEDHLKKYNTIYKENN